MYICGTIFYGIPLHFPNDDGEHSEFIQALKDDYLYDEPEKQIKGLYAHYHGGSDEQPMAFGVELAEFDTTVSYIDLNQRLFDYLLTAENQKKFQHAWSLVWNALDEKMRTEFSVYGEPRLFVLWSSS